MTEQIRLRTLLRDDPLYRAWFMRQPTRRIDLDKPFRLFVQREQGGGWAKVDIPSYAKAYTQVKLRLPDAWDMAIHSKAQHFAPPVLKYKGKSVYWPVPDGHTWCSLCRRPTVFRLFTRHPMISFPIDSNFPRCSLCGIRAESLKPYRTPLEWPVTT